MSSALPAALTHAGIHVRDPAAMARFYCDLFGFAVTDRGTLPLPEGGRQDLVFLSASPDEHHQLVLVSGRPPGDHFNVLNQLSYRVAHLDALRTVLDRLEGTPGVNDIQPVTHGNAISIYARDPEGNRLEFYLDTPWYVSQPVREPIDLRRPDQEIIDEIEALITDAPGFQPAAERRRAMVEMMTGP